MMDVGCWMDEWMGVGWMLDGWMMDVGNMLDDGWMDGWMDQQ